MENNVKLMQGNEACVEGAIAAGMRFYAGYPITPSTEIAELCAEKLPLVGGKFIQMEDEIASMAAIIGASLTGVKAMTATSGPGFSLKQENIGFAALTEVPCVIVNVQRGGPSTGLPTSPAQGDVMQARWGTHGDHPVIVLSPSSVEETYYVTVKAFNFAEKYRVPVIVLMDEVIGHMRERVKLPDLSELEVVDRVKPEPGKKDYYPYEVDSDDGVPPMASYGEGYRFHVTGLIHDKTGFPTRDPQITDRLIRRLINKIECNKYDIIEYKEESLDDAEIIVLSYGSTARSAQRAVRMAREEGIKAGWVQTVTIWPFPSEVVDKVCGKARTIIVPEMNLGQLVLEVERVAAGRLKIEKVNRVDGEMITPDEVLQKIKEVK
ncbi:2-oxoglutarate oxidoreductase subunit KorA [Koleobacter methoxysyntrophicus]|uniref:2-oxoglutarate oxidoreductase subunit KorA n=1 Tax=Koleobacter methoxysyntrophicus TaxID=2751313 RepID=A0A8A0RRN1_9FIRM|nr:2-oxoacid:acceptor oxidoreductase subunit alpha [Koleobacter methoxysyntrophicus]MDK2901501.1 2-oxoglutarate/2-oxoacid ferredoxin oxidoreductase subunit alpha [Thermosediminibacterales bacterium]QSQ10169.1 2-oxoglutarate oxidoreductase subunit KorA [Koleobacter methoxysyntrophicus]